MVHLYRSLYHSPCSKVCSPVVFSILFTHTLKLILTFITFTKIFIDGGMNPVFFNWYSQHLKHVNAAITNLLMTFAKSPDTITNPDFYWQQSRCSCLSSFCVQSARWLKQKGSGCRIWTDYSTRFHWLLVLPRNLQALRHKHRLWFKACSFLHSKVSLQRHV